MRLKRNIIIAAVLVVLCIVALIITSNIPDTMPYNEDEPKTENTAVVILDYEINSFVNEKIIIESEKPYTLLKTTNDKGEVQYIVEGYEDVKFINSSLNNIANNFSYVQMADVIDENPENLEIYGLDNPQGKYTLVNENGTSTTIIIGDKIGSMYYSMVDGNQTVYTIYAAYGNAVLNGINGYRETDIISLDSDDVGEDLLSFRVDKGANCIMNIRLPNENDKFALSTSRFIMTVPYSLPVYSKNFIEKLKNIIPIIVEEFVEENVINLGKYGLSSPAYTLTVEDVYGTYVVEFGNLNEDGTRVYCKEKGSNNVFAVVASKYEAISSLEPYYLCNRYAHIFNVETVSSVEVISADGSYNYNLSLKPETEQYFFLNGKPATEESFKSAYMSIVGMALTADGGDKVVKNKEMLRVVFNFNDGTSYKAIYHEHDDRNYALDRNGEKSNFLVSKKNVEQMIKEITNIETY